MNHEIKKILETHISTETVRKLSADLNDAIIEICNMQIGCSTAEWLKGKHIIDTKNIAK